MSSESHNAPLYQHAKRPQWGVALLAWERPTKRGYLFDDGTVRVIGKAFYQVMTRARNVEPSASKAFEAHLANMSTARTEALLGRQSGASDADFFSIEEQARLLLGEFAGGFAGEEWRTKHRGGGTTKHCKRHRDRMLRDGGELLGQERLHGLTRSGGHAEFWTSFSGICQRTDLLTAKETQTLARSVARAPGSLADSLRDLLSEAEADPALGETFATRFDAFVAQLSRALGAPPSWSLATLPLALVAPSEHACLHPTSLKRQGRWMARATLRSARPSASEYVRALGVLRDVAQQLTPLGAEPGDLLDVCDFIRITTSPSAHKRLTALRGTQRTGDNGGASDETSDAMPHAAADIGTSDSEAA